MRTFFIHESSALDKIIIIIIFIMILIKDER